MSTTTARGLTRQQQRSMQRAVHLVAGLAIIVQLYASSLLGTGLTVALQWVVVPVVVVSGLVMWKGPRIRRALRRRDDRRA